MSKPTLKQKTSGKEQFSALLGQCQQYLAEVKKQDDAAEYQKLIDLARYYLAEIDDESFWVNLNVNTDCKDYYLFNNLKVATSALSCRIEDAGFSPDIPEGYVFQ
jgi:hypothetical protein